jgi:predicted nucleic acid-binding protein
VRFWDSSAIVPLLVEEPRSNAASEILRQDHEMVVWWATGLECLSAVRRRERAGAITAAEADTATGLLTALAGSWHEVVASDEVRARASRALTVHGLKAADSLQLAGALIWKPLPVAESGFVTLDARLAEAARGEGFSLPL